MAKSLLVISGRVLQLMHKPCIPGGAFKYKEKNLGSAFESVEILPFQPSHSML